jgi:hypothetical protein
MKRTTSICASIVTVAGAFIVCCLFNGCAHRNSKAAVYEPIRPEHRAASEPQVVTDGSNSPLQYQWYSTNRTTAAVTVEGASGSNASVLFYQWYKNTNQ